ncbi:hypothetical protein BDK51DRAFT_48197 [Blyttiomyces helicus]|uniref:Uncharacterized protein n=1 Tax=Blyttiomyces helicus TaxID=388810 RepID=A0A4P9W3J8_9FUNG|nr:hypothetical protein BDK51DRAFT_48197 [Blyttiomyces helicus]|eukprot:RKO85240.1 hypothetical protein BDK51DRAFT_48197 [Blyttiomyces helicus]
MDARRRAQSYFETGTGKGKVPKGRRAGGEGGTCLSVSPLPSCLESGTASGKWEVRRASIHAMFKASRRLHYRWRFTTIHLELTQRKKMAGENIHLQVLAQPSLDPILHPHDSRPEPPGPVVPPVPITIPVTTAVAAVVAVAVVVAVKVAIALAVPVFPAPVAAPTQVVSDPPENTTHVPAAGPGSRLRPQRIDTRDPEQWATVIRCIDAYIAAPPAHQSRLLGFIGTALGGPAPKGHRKTFREKCVAVKMVRSMTNGNFSYLSFFTSSPLVIALAGLLTFAVLGFIAKFAPNPFFVATLNDAVAFSCLVVMIVGVIRVMMGFGSGHEEGHTGGTP